MQKTLCTFLLAGVAILPVNAYSQSMVTTQTNVSTSAEQNLTQDQLNAIKSGGITNKGQAIPVETQVMMSTGNLDSYTIGKIQQSLVQQGYYKGAITGTLDTGTTAALQNYQRANGNQVDETGKMISSGTLARLGVTMDKLTAGDGARVAGTATINATQASPNANTHASYNPYTSSTVKTLGTLQTIQTSAANVTGPVLKTTVPAKPAVPPGGPLIATRIGTSRIASAPEALPNSLEAGDTSSANIKMTGSLTDSQASSLAEISPAAGGGTP